MACSKSLYNVFWRLLYKVRICLFQPLSTFINLYHEILKSRTVLNYSQLKKLRHEVESNISNNQVGQAIADHEEPISHCPHCNSHESNRRV
jgi:hypothetical protein